MLPRPPKPETTIEFVTQLLAISVVAVFLGLPIVALVIKLVQPQADVGYLIEIELEMMKVTMAALVGFLAGDRIKNDT